ncbi:protein DpdE [Donghicola tyrosinivorans]|uniref:ATP-dependent helicase HepA n=1 Tax=Donghicola tyrosinivorans TaxID=1652492 RepID=A0A2T0WB02_9RHOB|nr:protein DpdE [Donghicola tyrosinivorans]PRY83806.1 ATP-dependent helicase HepA [Donghicola tyrosinivorans]
MFVEALSGECQGLGIGKLIAKQGSSSTVEYFVAPGADMLLREVRNADLCAVDLPGQTRIYHFNEATGAWEVGRLIEVMGEEYRCRFPNKSDRDLSPEEAYVRCNLPISDPTDFLAEKFTETPRFSDGRRAFVESIISQRGVTMGMSALISSAIDFESHQVEVVRRILQDPVQRYMLADEVGLGKTIEAGILIRQCVLDLGERARVLIMVPAALIQQWRHELDEKFFLGSELDETVHVVALTEHATIRRHLRHAKMLVIDEAHHLTGGHEDCDRDLYDSIAAAAPGIERVILMSATPALHNERGFLEMLHILDPDTYPLDDEEGFRHRIESRQVLAQIVAELAPENVLYLDHTLDQLADHFPIDSLLQNHVDDLRDISANMPEETDPDLIEAINRVRAHISEVYRLHHRILRHRRRNVGGLTPERDGLEICNYHSHVSGRLFETIEAWRSEATLRLQNEASSEAFASLLRRTQTWADPCTEDSERISALSVAGDMAALATLPTLLGDEERITDRFHALAETLRPLQRPKRQFVVFCSDELTADKLAATLSASLEVTVDRHAPDCEEWQAFNHDPTRPILVCDHRAEEGLNLQGGEKIVVHYDLPFSPNRIEQRLGRVDRYGSGKAVKSIAVVCANNAYEVEWARFLSEALQVFDRSIASLQYVVEDMVRHLEQTIFVEGPEAITDLIAANQGNAGRIEREVAAIDQQDALDALGEPSSDIVDAICDIEGAGDTIVSAVSGWVETCLMFERSALQGERTSNGSDKAPFSYRYVTDGRHTLIPLEAFLRDCEKAIEHSEPSRRQPLVRTYPMTFSRRLALKQDARLLKTRLLRYGETFTDGIWRFSQVDERGRSTALWRYFPGYQAETLADLFFRFDFIVEPDLADAIEVLSRTKCLTEAAKAALSRRGDMALPPFHESIWLDQDLAQVTDPALLEKLDQAYRPDATDQGGRDYNLNSERWRHLDRLRLGQVADWRTVCRNARAKAEAELRNLPVFIDRLRDAERRAVSVNQGRLGQLRARVDRRNLASDEHDWKLERDIAMALTEGILNPSVRLDAITASFLTGSLRASAIVDGKA